MKYLKLFGMLLGIAWVAPSCGIFDQGMKLDFSRSEAFFVSLKDKTIFQAEEIGQQKMLKADFWVEHSDPEIGAIGYEFHGTPHEGEPTALMPVPGISFEKLDSVPSDRQWQNHIPAHEIQKGLVFLIKDRFDEIHKIQVTKFDQQSQKVNFKSALIEG